MNNLHLGVLWVAEQCAHGHLQDGTHIVIEPPSTLIVTLPTAEREARYHAAIKRRAEHEDWERRRKEAVAAKIADPKRSLASLAREYDLSSSSLSKWVKAAQKAAA